MTQRDPAGVNTFIERFASAFTEAGVPRMAARTFAALLTADSGRCTAAELAETAQASPAAISGAVRYLQQVGLVAREREPGTRRDVYTVHDNVWYEAMFSREQLLQRWSALFWTGAQALGQDTPAGRRVAETAEFFDFFMAEMPAMLGRWKTYREQRQA
ncbi:MarR family transcriptional regulator [Dactylosporangium sp. NPDC051484]|uniref:GbsR/MarR family transcriptional regulator n=1 Tax=Dactylosporangium sp. NPDC051484 TaxID=3154942 RepID=UPI003450D6D7